jgi:hypothetical protein
MAMIFVAWVALHAEKRFSLALQVIGDTPMRVMANGTVFNNWHVFECERTLFFDVALNTEFRESFGFNVSFSSAVGIMARRTIHFFLADGMMRWIINLSSLAGVA